ncbi:MAG: hypothetical protein GX325_02285 [Peptococcaceae bacterium]|nr:hypothetical protein [Peptococcaceae bacterium]
MSEIGQEVLDAVKKVAQGGQITCTQARALAKDLQVEPIIIGKAADELKIKVISCELGCF